jgi:hypothetical protein
LGWDVGAKVFFQSKQSQRNQGEEEDCRLQESEIEEETRKEACKDNKESGKTKEETYKEEENCKGPLDHD